MVGSLRGSNKRKGGEGDSCPVCLDLLVTEHNFVFPCGHKVCSDCEDRLTARRFLSCPTCRTPREGVTPSEVDAANHARVNEDTPPVYRGNRVEIIFFQGEMAQQDPTFFQGEMEESPPTEPAQQRVALTGPIRDLVNALTNPTNLSEFLAVRDRVRRMPARSARRAARPT